MGIYHFSEAAPEPDGPVLVGAAIIVTWLITVVAFLIIDERISDRNLDWGDEIMMLGVVPLVVRAALVTVVLLYGTNNVQTAGMSVEEIYGRELGSKLVMLTRIMYATCLWTVKYSYSMILMNLHGYWELRHDRLLHYLHILLAATFISTILGVLGPFLPITGLWQVVPDPGPRYRQGYVFLFNTGRLNILTNLAFIFFPVPTIFRRNVRPAPNETMACLLYYGELCLRIALTICQLVTVPAYLGGQSIRSLIASFDILLSIFGGSLAILSRKYRNGRYR